MEATTATKSPVLIYTEQTPNPESLKFVTNKMLYAGTADFRTRELALEYSPLASALFELPYVKSVYISNNFITLTKELNYEWEDMMIRTKEFIKNYVAEEKPIIREGFAEAMTAIEEKQRAEISYSDDDGELVQRIKELIDTYVKPAVEMDGGNIEFKSYNDGIVTLIMQGACSGCPSSTVTLKSGIEAMLKRMMPQVKEVVQEMA
ncbi:MAG: NifU family protein [Saprospiraceae bacterium]|uniref:NifU family protein n=1 Tax=Candidatus Opimibacter skivensis TaxID=2982028 RepID=A0A9D7SWW5_9BACT|nr:NifU family protein [Candidatus Opimibacter skivensis]